MLARTYSELKSIDRKFLKDALIARKIEQRQRETLKAVENMRYGSYVLFAGLTVCAILTYFIK